MLTRRVAGPAQQVGLAIWARAAGTLAPPRNTEFALLQDSDLAVFDSILGSGGVITDPHEVDPYNRDWMGKYRGRGRCVLRPRSTAQVSAVLRHCSARRLAVVPQGGNTGLVGGSVPVHDEVVLSTGLMTTLLGFDPGSGALTAQAGAVLATLEAAARERGHAMPLDLGASGSCAIGGNVATNAGGIRLLRHGPLHGSVLGLEVVLAGGQVLDLLSSLRKDNTGYDLKQLFIGSEGTLGVITAVAIQCPAASPATSLAYLAVPSFKAAQQVLQAARQNLGELLSAFEFLDRESLEVAKQFLPGARDPLPGSDAPFFLVVEIAGSSEQHNAAMLEAFLESTMGEGRVLDGVVAQDSRQAGEIWALREGITEALRHRGAIYKYDLSFRVEEMYGVVGAARERLASAYPSGFLGGGAGSTAGSDTEHALKVVGYGHLGDGNVHLNISAPRYDAGLEALIEPWVYEFTAAHSGSISAEHGLGRMKAPCIGYSKPPEAVRLMRSIKAAFDPQGILNPYKVLPPE
ncbi:hypothetical protein ACKKBG_A16540 [Auxenochlorella protothecoides x Auxenochlorella symbiontica]